MPPFIRIRYSCRSSADQCSRDFVIPPEPMPAVCDSWLRHLADTKADSENSEHGSDLILAATSSWRCPLPAMTDWHLHDIVTASSGRRQAGVGASTCTTASKEQSGSLTPCHSVLVRSGATKVCKVQKVNPIACSAALF